jgi:four helix bundle protein
MQDYTKLLVWQRARSLTVAIHDVTRDASTQAAPGLRSQLMRAVMSISANIAEGAARDSRIDFARFLTIAIGSTSEAQHHLLVCRDLGLLNEAIEERLTGRVVEVRRMLFSLRRAILEREAEARSTQGARPSDAAAVDPELSN